MQSDEEQRFERPINSLPPVVIILTLLLVGIEVVFQLSDAGILGGPRGVGWRVAAIEAYGYSPAILDRVLVNGDYSFNTLRRFVAYPFLNTQITSVAFCAALVLALGKFTAELFGGLKVLMLFLLASIVGAVVYGTFVEGRLPLLGAFTPVYGLIGAYTYALWLSLGKAGENQLLAFRLIGFLLLIQLIFGLIFGAGNQWVSELSGFATGFLLATVLVPGGWAALLARLRDRS